MKIGIIGGGSYLWSLGFCRQFMRSERLRDAEVVLMDVDARALELVGRCVDILAQKQGAQVRFARTTEMTAALDGADFVIVSISTGGLNAMQHDLEIPEKYGIWHTVGDTVGPGGWSRAVRNVPVFREIGARMKELCPKAWMVNVSNPLTPLTRTPQKLFGIKSLGMCPGVEHQARTFARLAGVADKTPVDYVVTGVDHGSWYTDIHAGSLDVLARLKELGYCRSDGRLPTEVTTADPLAEAAHTRAAFAVWREVGYLPSIGDRHIVENFPWFVARPTGELPFQLKRTSIADRRARRQRSEDTLKRFADTRDDSVIGGLGHGDDPVASLIEALTGQTPFLYCFNYMNVGQTPGLPDGAVVETRCRFDGAGVHPLSSPMPDLLKTLTLPIVLRQEMVIDVALNGTFDDFVALMTTDPLCSRLEMGQCRAMARELLEANRAWIRNPKLLEF